MLMNILFVAVLVLVFVLKREVEAFGERLDVVDVELRERLDVVTLAVRFPQVKLLADGGVLIAAEGVEPFRCEAEEVGLALHWSPDSPVGFLVEAERGYFPSAEEIFG